MTDIFKELAAVGERLPERPRAGLIAYEWLSHVYDLESLARRLAVMLAEAERKSCQHRFAANPGMYDTSYRYCEICGVAE